MKPQYWLKALLSFHRVLYATPISKDMIQVGVALFPSFKHFYINIHDFIAMHNILNLIYIFSLGRELFLVKFFLIVNVFNKA